MMSKTEMKHIGDVIANLKTMKKRTKERRKQLEQLKHKKLAIL